MMWTDARCTKTSRIRADKKSVDFHFGKENFRKNSEKDSRIFITNSPKSGRTHVHQISTNDSDTSISADERDFSPRRKHRIVHNEWIVKFKIIPEKFEGDIFFSREFSFNVNEHRSRVFRPSDVACEGRKLLANFLSTFLTSDGPVISEWDRILKKRLHPEPSTKDVSPRTKGKGLLDREAQAWSYPEVDPSRKRKFEEHRGQEVIFSDPSCGDNYPCTREARRFDRRRFELSAVCVISKHDAFIPESASDWKRELDDLVDRLEIQVRAGGHTSGMIRRCEELCTLVGEMFEKSKERRNLRGNLGPGKELEK